jgi:hypothetical protein
MIAAPAAADFLRNARREKALFADIVSSITPEAEQTEWYCEVFKVGLIPL